MQHHCLLTPFPPSTPTQMSTHSISASDTLRTHHPISPAADNDDNKDRLHLGATDDLHHLLPIFFASPTSPPSTSGSSTSSRITIADCQAYHRDEVHRPSPHRPNHPKTISPTSSLVLTTPRRVTSSSLQLQNAPSGALQTIHYTLSWYDYPVLEEFLRRHRSAYELGAKSQSRMARRQIR